jgi:BON domain-containing protein
MADEPKQYVIERVHRALAQDPRVAAFDVEVTLAGGRVFVTGEVPTQERKDAISEVLGELLPEQEICNETTVATLAHPAETEELS